VARHLPLLLRPFFTARIFFFWLAQGLAQSLIVFFLPLRLYAGDEGGDVAAVDGSSRAGPITAVDGSGRASDFPSIGLVVYTCVVLVVNLKMALKVRSWTWVHVGALLQTTIVRARPSLPAGRNRVCR
jgi:hypothetical protein